MKYRFLVFALIIVLISGFYSCYSIIPGYKPADIDIIYINEIVKISEVNFKNLGSAQYPHKKYRFDIVRASSKNYEKKINEAIRNGDTVVDLHFKNNIVGKIVFYTNYKTMYNTAINKLIRIIEIIFVVLLFIIICYLIYLQKIIYTPFRKLQKFASSVAAGNLDIHLEMDKSNFFGAFTESFDIMREELKISRQNEYLANISKKELVASLSHDVKTPVASIKAVSELVMVTTSEEKTKKQLEAIYKKADQIDKLITDMFNSTLEELSQLNVNVTEQFSSILEDIIKASDYYEKVKKPDIPDCIIKVDSLRIQQVFDNIINNSYKYANTQIDIDFILTNTHLEVSINDYGKGIKEEELPLLFNKFYRGENSKGQSGSGLGLYISKYFMEKQEGDISCYNRNNGFTVKLLIKLA